MDHTTLIRNFGSSAYRPRAARVRIFSDRWYTVTMQNVERGPGDFLGLGEGEYTELVPGADARGRRDARLNHCNRVAEHTGPVYRAAFRPYATNPERVTYHATEQAARAWAEGGAENGRARWITDLTTERDRALARAETADGPAFNAAFYRNKAADCARVLAEAQATPWPWSIKQIR